MHPWKDMSEAPKDRLIVIAYCAPEYLRCRAYSLAHWDDATEEWVDEFGDFVIADPRGWVPAHPASIETATAQDGARGGY